MNDYSIIVYIILGVLMLWLILKIFAKPIKWIFKLLFNTLTGFALLFIFNYLGSYIGISLSVGWVSAVITGVLGIPGIILLLLIENFFI